MLTRQSMQGSHKDVRDAQHFARQQNYKYSAASTYQSGSPLHNPYDDAAGYARPISASSKQIRHALSLQDPHQPTPSLSGTGKLPSETGLTRSQLAEQKHIRRQSPISDSHSSQSRSMSVERSRPSSASLRSTRESLSREPSSRRLSSIERSQSGAAEISNYGGSRYRHSMSRSASRPASPGRSSSRTIPAYNPSFGRSTVTPSNSKLPSTTASCQSLGNASFRLTAPDASLRKSSTSNTSASHPYATQASHSWGALQSTANKQSNSSAGDSELQDFLGMMEKRKAEAPGSSMHSQPRRSSSNPKAFLELGGQLVSSSMASLGDKLRSITSPQRRTSSSSASLTAQIDRLAYAEDHQSAADRPAPKCQLSHQSSAGPLNLPSASCDASGDRGHIFSLSKPEDNDRSLRSDLPKETPVRGCASHHPSRISLSGNEAIQGFESTAGAIPRSRALGLDSASRRSAFNATEHTPETQMLGGAAQQDAPGCVSANASRSSDWHPLMADSRQDRSASDEQCGYNRQSGQGQHGHEHMHSMKMPGEAPELRSSQVAAPAQQSVHDSSSVSRHGQHSTAGTAQRGRFELASSSASHAVSSSQGLLPRSRDAPPGESTFRHESAAESAAGPEQAESESTEAMLQRIHRSLRKPISQPKPGLHTHSQDTGHTQRLEAGSEQDSGKWVNHAGAGARVGGPGVRGAGVEGAQAPPLRSNAAAPDNLKGSPSAHALAKSSDTKEPHLEEHTLHWQADAEQRADAEQQAKLQPAYWHSVQSQTDASAGIPSDKAMSLAHANPAESAHEPAESASAKFEAAHAESASTQLPSEARHVAAQLAVSVLMPHHDEDLRSPSASYTHTQGSSQRPAAPQQPSIPLPHSSSSQRSTQNPSTQSAPSSAVLRPQPHASALQEGLLDQPSTSAASLCGPQAASMPLQSLPQEGSLPLPDLSPGTSAQLAGSIPELNAAVQLSLSQDCPPGFRADTEEPQISQSPSRQESGLSPELREAVRMSLSHEFLPADFEPASSQQPSMPSSHPVSTSSSSSTDSSAASDVSDATEYADPVLPEEEKQHADPPSPSLPEPAAPSLNSPEPAQSGHYGHAPVLDSPGTVHAAQSSATGHLGSFSPKPVPQNSPDASASEARPSAAALPEEESPQSPSAAPASSSVQASPPAILTSSSHKPPDLSPGTAAQINKDEALARKLQTLELEDNPEAADAAGEEASGGDHDNVDVAALQDVEVPLVGDQLPLAALVEDYEGSPRVYGNLLPLMQRFPYFRRIRAHQKLLLTSWQGIDDAYYKHVRMGYHYLKELICLLGDGRLQPEVMEQHLCQPQVDQSIVCFLRAVTALELFSNETRYMTFVPGIDAYRGLSIEEIVYQAVLVMGTEVEHLQVKALVATLPVRLKILDVAGSAAGIYTFEPTPIGSNSPTGASAQQTAAGQSPASAKTQPDADVQKLWLIYRPGHYEIVYPAEGSEDVEKL
ncbi:MAG: hypothetical protein FRX49_09619 [Trebouxia sp. A1-2]|nr:MAG: hypothetical protein FRX49_09619 [Trebouxia sp. A1-2]